MIRENQNIIVFLLILVSATFFINVTAQDLNKEVYVVSSFKPEVSDAGKIGKLPVIDDTSTYKPKADYTVLPSRLKSSFELRPIKPAKMAGTPLDKLYNSYLKAGFGNYNTPVAEYSIHNLRSKEYSIGAYIFHRSSYNKIKLENGHKVPAGYGNNDILLYGKRFYKDVNVTGDIGLNTRRLRHYGYNVDNFDTVPDLEIKDIKQSFFKLYGQVGVYSAEADSGAFQYTLNLKGEYFADHFSTKEPNVDFNLSVSHLIKSFRLGLNASAYYASFSADGKDYGDGIFEINPYVKKKKEEWEIKLAGRLFVENNEENNIYIFPEASLRIRIINQALFTKFGVTGYLENNSYQSMSDVNPYITPGVQVGNTLHRFVVYGGIEGHLSRNTTYHARVTFDAMENAPFFVNDTISELENTFNIVYDQADLIKYYFDLYYSPLKYLDFGIRSNVYSYKMAGIEKPWHKPAYDLNFTTRYNFREKIYASVELLTLGKRYAQDLSGDGEYFTLDPIFDLNLKIEYKYSNILTGFLHFYNLASQQYYLWNRYPGQRINIILGITYKF
ncbi:MAG: hypothetical protein JW894_05015 [Bacteroidales bacterium]|nr:hypothetical protein [Bacteroidales bacterium]